jgi:hypothetical protein
MKLVPFELVHFEGGVERKAGEGRDAVRAASIKRGLAQRRTMLR